MATKAEFQKLVENLGVECDCPVCGYSWPGCQGACVAHETVTGQQGPYHEDYNDDCDECLDSYQGYWDADALIKANVSRKTVEELLLPGFRSIAFNVGVRERLAECDKDPSLPHVLVRDPNKRREH